MTQFGEEFHILLPDTATVSNGDVEMNRFASLGTLHAYDLTTQEELPERLAEMDGIICNKTILNEQVLAGAKNLRYIGLFATGYNNIDLDYAHSHGITVCNAGQYSTEAVAQHTFALILTYFSRIREYSQFVEEGRWVGWSTFCPLLYDMQELAGKTLGIVGFGSIGQRVAQIGKAFGMEILVYTRSPRESQEIRFVTLEELAAQSDILSLHCPLNDQSAGMCNASFFASCKPGAFFVNTARGGIVEEQALYDALEQGKLGGAAVDVLAQEPMAEDCVLRKAPRMLITPHIAWGATQTRERVVQIAYDNLKNYLAGHPTHVI